MTTAAEVDAPDTRLSSPQLEQPESSTGIGPAKPKILFLSGILANIPGHRRLAFINDLKAAIRKGQFDGGPLDDTFQLVYQVRTKEGPAERRNKQREFVIDGGEGFQKWYELHLNLVKKTSGLPTKFEIESGHVSIHDLATKFRRRKSGKSRAKASGSRNQAKE